VKKYQLLIIVKIMLFWKPMKSNGNSIMCNNMAAIMKIIIIIIIIIMAIYGNVAKYNNGNNHINQHLGNESCVWANDEWRINRINWYQWCVNDSMNDHINWRRMEMANNQYSANVYGDEW